MISPDIPKTHRDRNDAQQEQIVFETSCENFCESCFITSLSTLNAAEEFDQIRECRKVRKTATHRERMSGYSEHCLTLCNYRFARTCQSRSLMISEDISARTAVPIAIISSRLMVPFPIAAVGVSTTILSSLWSSSRRLPSARHSLQARCCDCSCRSCCCCCRGRGCCCCCGCRWQVDY